MLSPLDSQHSKRNLSAIIVHSRYRSISIFAETASQEEVMEFLLEMAIVKQFSHRHIVTMYGSCMNDGESDLNLSEFCFRFS